MFLALAFGISPLASTSAWALSEIQREQLPPSAGEATQATPDAAAPTAPAAPDAGKDATPAPDATEPAEQPGAQDVQSPPPPIEYDLSKLPEPVKRTHDQLIEIAKSGDIEKLRPLLGTGDDATQLSVGEVANDPIEFLKSASGDGNGYEILAILQEILSAGYVHLDAGDPEELYVWPYFFAVPLDKLDGRQQVELFKLITAGDFEEMKSVGNYIFYRAGITPQGRFAFFLAGD
ncbi:MAG: hypothetical protein INR68_13505 [Methylobacterium mesophilicum]|nr:hypothetical protein [Methylobacterium mesophilicum]